MSETINGTPSFSNAHTVPTAGQLITGAAHKAYAQTLANNTKWAYDEITNGVKKIRVAATISALKALTGMGDNEQALCPGVGLFRYKAGASTTPNDVLVVAPDAGGGRWYHAAHDARDVAYGLCPLDSANYVPVARLRTNVANGVAGLDGSAKVPSSQLPKRMVDQYITTTPKQIVVTESGWVANGLVFPDAVIAGDTLVVKVSLPIAADPDLGWEPATTLSLRVTGSTFSTTGLGSTADMNAEVIKQRIIPGWAVLTATGNPDHVRLEVSVAGAVPVRIYPAIMVVEQWRS